MRKNTLLCAGTMLCLIGVLTGCQPSAQQSPDVTKEIKEAILSQVDWTEDDGLKYVLVSEVEDGMDISVSFGEPFNAADFGTCAADFVDATKSAFDGRKEVVSHFSVNYMIEEDLVFIWSSSDLSSGLLFDYRKDPPAGVSTKLSDLKNKGVDGITTSKFDNYIKDNNVTLTASDVQYNMSNNVGNKFSLVGTATLSDYYNYGFSSSIESTYFCMRVAPVNGSYTDGWYIYCHRDSFGKLFDDLQSGSVTVSTVCQIPSSRYKSGQGNMAQLEYVVW
ncbi:hypothetical protein CE91St43_05810 [Oscillospiraceae bacterium]|nr:hypothetical protein CE91St43_05810 [Oscillospiraceae bacterium]